MNPTAPIHGYLSPAEAAEYLGITIRTLAEWRHSQSGPPYIRLGGPTGRVRYARSDLDRWMGGKRRGTQWGAETC
jgi:excisionase family DNA binding protein